jgi:transposase
MKAQDARSLPVVAQEALRQKAVRAVLAGTSQSKVSRILGVCRYAVIQWVQAFRQGGSRAVKAKRRGRPKGAGALLPWQAAQVVRAVEDRTPDQFKMPFFLWTREAVVELIERRYGLRLSVWTVGRYLARWGFTPQKPVRRAFEQDSEAVQRWLREDYPAIRRQAKREKARIYWEDEMGLRSDHATGRTYARRGQTPAVPGTGQRFGCNMISAITNRGHLSFMVFKCRFTAEVFLRFLQRLTRQVPQKIFLIADGHPVHKARKVREWLDHNRRRIRLFLLPSYSPELNPDEMLNNDVKSNAVGRRRAKSQPELVENVRGFLRSRQRQPQIVKHYFHEQSVRYAAE